MRDPVTAQSGSPTEETPVPVDSAEDERVIVDAPPVSASAEGPGGEAAAEADAPAVANPALLAERALALAAIHEITPPATVGGEAGHEALERNLVTLFFANTMPGYPGWRWAATLALVPEGSPATVLEVELVPGEDALVAPDWVPWSERLQLFREAQAQQLAEARAAAAARKAAGIVDDDDDDDEDEDDDEDDILVNDFSDFDPDMQGVDVDDLYESHDDDDDHDDDDHDDDDHDDDHDDDDHDDDDHDGDDHDGDDHDGDDREDPADDSEGDPEDAELDNRNRAHDETGSVTRGSRGRSGNRRRGRRRRGAAHS